jgi:hypothetical protein
MSTRCQLLAISVRNATSARLFEAGYVEGENVAIESRWAENQLGRLPELAIDLVRRRVAVIAALGSNLSALAAKEAATTIPVVFIVSEDPVRLGLVTSLARPGGNLTGINFLNAELAAKTEEPARPHAGEATDGQRGDARAHDSTRGPRCAHRHERMPVMQG